MDTQTGPAILATRIALAIQAIQIGRDTRLTQIGLAIRRATRPIGPAIRRAIRPIGLVFPATQPTGPDIPAIQPAGLGIPGSRPTGLDIRASGLMVLPPIRTGNQELTPTDPLRVTGPTLARDRVDILRVGPTGPADRAATTRRTGLPGRQPGRPTTRGPKMLPDPAAAVERLATGTEGILAAAEGTAAQAEATRAAAPPVTVAARAKHNG